VGGLLGGLGLAGNVVVNGGGTITSGGANGSINGLGSGTLTVSNLTIGGNSSYVWNLLYASKGISTHDLLVATGAGTCNHTPASPWTIAVTTNSSTIWDFNTSTNFTILQSTNSFTADPAAITISAGTQYGYWSVTNTTSGLTNSLLLVYTAVGIPIVISTTNNPTIESQDIAVGTPFTNITVNPSPLVMNGPDEYILDLSNSYSGNTYIASGTLTASNNSSFGNSPAIYLGYSNNGDTTSNAAVNILVDGVVVTNAVNALGSGTNTIASTNTGSGTYSGPVSVSNNVTLASAGIMTLSGVLSGAGSVTVAGSGTTVLSESNTYTGRTYLNAGTLDLANQYSVKSSVLTMNGGTLAFDPVVSGNLYSVGGLAATNSGVGWNWSQ